MPSTQLSPLSTRPPRRPALAAALAALLAATPLALAAPAGASAAAAPSATKAPPAAGSVTADAAFRSVAKAARERVAAGYSPAIVAAVVSADQAKPRVFAVGGSVTAKTTFEIGSITKTFTATLLAEMVGRGEVKLSDLVSSLLPAGTVVPSLYGRQITLEDLATHRSGLPREATDLFPGGTFPESAEDVAKSYAAYTPERLLAFLKSYTLPRQPGAEFEYSNLGEGLLGYALSVRAGQSYEPLLRERVLAPLGLTSIGLTSTPFASPHDADGRPLPAIDLGVLAPAGSLRSTATALARFARANLLALTEGAPGPLSDAMRLALAPRADIEGPQRIGLNWIVGDAALPQLIWHNGGTFGETSYLGIDPVAKIAVVVLNASDVAVDDIGNHALNPAVQLLTYPTERRVSSAVLPQYTGQYDLGEGAITDVRRAGNRLEARTPGSAPVLLRPLSRDRFFTRSGLKIKFTRDRRGHVNGVRVEARGETIKGTRVKA